MKVNLRRVTGNWDEGFVLDKHTLWSTCTGHNEFGHPTFETMRSEVGEALYQLKYRQDFSKIDPLADAIVAHISPLFAAVGLVVPMPPSKWRPRQPVSELGAAVAKRLNVISFDNILQKAPNSVQLKNLTSRDEKIEALRSSFQINDGIESKGKWNALLVDDLFDSGASAEAACATLRTYPKIRKVYFAALTWK